MGEITSGALVAAVEKGEDLCILDVRAPFRLESGRIDIVAEDRFFNVKGSDLLALDDPRAAGLDPDRPLTVVCGVGNDSKRIADYLHGRGFQAASLRGGMTAWMRALVVREWEPPPSLDRLIQLDRIGKGALGYLLLSDGEAFVIDAPRCAEPFLELIDAAGARVCGIADTHAHADYISGGPALATILDAPYYLHDADAIYPYDGTPGTVVHEPLADGQVLRVGRAELTVVHTPGHTEGSITYRLGDDAAFTGDFLFVGSVGRPDLGGKTEEWTKVLWRSMERARAEWPDDLAICPAHYGSAAERKPDRSVGGRFGDLRTSNEPFALPTEEAFTAWVRARAGSFPDVYRRIKRINVGLEQVDDSEADELEAGKNECALG